MTSESEFLRRHARQALVRLRQTTLSMGNDVVEPLRLRPLVQRRPWWSVSAAIVAGFVAGLSLRRRKATASAPSGRVHELLAAANRRLRRLVRTALGATILANLRGNPHAADAAAVKPEAQTAPVMEELAAK